jgi:hypothetical protein
MYTPAYREGYFMSAEDQRTAKALLLLKRSETGERLALLKYKAGEIGDMLEAVSKQLKSNPEEVEFHDDGLILAEYKKLGILVRDIKTTIAKLQEIEGTIERGTIAG